MAQLRPMYISVKVKKQDEQRDVFVLGFADSQETALQQGLERATKLLGEADNVGCFRIFDKPGSGGSPTEFKAAMTVWLASQEIVDDEAIDVMKSLADSLLAMVEGGAVGVINQKGEKSTQVIDRKRTGGKN